MSQLIGQIVLTTSCDECQGAEVSSLLNVTVHQTSALISLSLETGTFLPQGRPSLMVDGQNALHSLCWPKRLHLTKTKSTAVLQNHS